MAEKEGMQHDVTKIQEHDRLVSESKALRARGMQLRERQAVVRAPSLPLCRHTRSP